MRALHPLSPLFVVWTHRRLILKLTRRKIEARYRGSVLGLLWTLINPLLLLSVYTFVFSVVFRARWGGLPHEGQTQFALFLFSGLILFMVFAECVNEAPTLLIANRTYIKQLVFPVEVVAWVTLLASLFNFLVSFLILSAFFIITLGTPPWTWVFLPLLLAPLVLLTLGVTWLFASLGVFFRDLAHVVGVATTAVLFLSPIFYPASRIPEAFQKYYHLNPFVPILEMSRQSMFFGTPPDAIALAKVTGAAWIVAWCGFLWFMKTKRGFADVL